MNHPKTRKAPTLFLLASLILLPGCFQPAPDAAEPSLDRARVIPPAPLQEQRMAPVTAGKQSLEIDRGRKNAQRANLPATVPMAAGTLHMEMAAVSPGRLTGKSVQFAASPREFNTEGYRYQADNSYLRATEKPLSTFSADVDTASYANVRRFLTAGTLPPKDAVRIEELVNYFTYSYPQPKHGEPFGVKLDAAEAPWNPAHRLVRIGIQSKSIDWHERQASNLVFLIDVSGSMHAPNKLPLVVQSLSLLTQHLNEKDRVTLVVYAGASGVVLPPTAGSHRSTILQALQQLQAGGSTNGASGIELAYRLAKENFVNKGINRVILATDGDFNVGVTSQGELVRLIQESAKSGVYLTVLGFGMGNIKDDTLEQLADRGNGNYAYIDTAHEARKVFVDQIGGTLQTVAKDVKFQVEFNPAIVDSYRLIGYENRLLQDHEFNDDTVDAGDVGAGHAVTALYEIIPAGGVSPNRKVDALKYQKVVSADAERIERRGLSEPKASGASAEMLTLKIRYKEPDGETSRLIVHTLRDGGTLAQADADFRFSAAVAAWGMVLRDAPHKGSATPEMALALATPALGADAYGYRAEFVTLVHKAKALRPTTAQMD